MFHISVFMVIIKKVNKFNKTLLQVIQYSESELHTFEFVTCKFHVVYTHEYIVNKIY